MLDNIYIYGLLIPIIYFIVRADSKIEVLIAIFISTYIIMQVVSTYTGIRIDISSYHDSAESKSRFTIAFYLFFLGWFVQKLFRKKVFKNYFKKEIKPLNYFYELILIGLLIIEFSLTGFDIFSGKAIYGNDTKDTYFFEFINIIYVLAVFNLRNRLNNRLLILMSLHILLAIADGHRLMGITTALLIFIIKFIPQISKKKMLIYMCAALISLEGVSMLRSGLNFSDLSSHSVRDESYNTHQGSVIYSTYAIMDFGKQYDIEEKLYLSREYTLSLLFSKFWIEKNDLFTERFKSYTYRPGGGLLIAFFYAFFGWIGPLIAGVLIGYSLAWGRYIDKSLHIPPYAYLLIILIPRYFVYTPIHIFKTVLFTYLVYLFFYKLSK